ncbi:MAG: RNA polymerase sigma factor [Leptospiraceae bacterium]|nr:RNA polymerase sigma factor [Leptospiraceae bacterium]
MDTLQNLAIKAKNGDSGSYSELLKLSSSTIRPFLNNKIFQKSDVDDVLQEILISVHKSFSTYEADKNFKSWLFSIVNYRLIDYFRKQKKRSQDVTFSEWEEKPILVEDTLEDEKGELMRLMKLLPEKQFTVLKYLKLEDMSVRKVSILMGISESNVKVIAHRAIKALKKMVNK